MPSNIILTEYINPGLDLLRFIATRVRLNPTVVRAFANQILTAVGGLHDMGIVHRDLKPENIMVAANDVDPANYHGYLARRAIRRSLNPR